MGEVVRAIDKACFVHGAHEHLESNDGIDDDDEDDKEGNLDERKERHHNCIEHNLNITFVFGAQDKETMSSICFRRCLVSIEPANWEPQRQAEVV